MSPEAVTDASQRPEIDPGDRFQRRRPTAAGLVFPARIAITGSSLRTAALGLGDGPGPAGGARVCADGSVLPDRLVSPGMSAAVEIKTGKRSVLSFLLSPIARSVSEAGRER